VTTLDSTNATDSQGLAMGGREAPDGVFVTTAVDGVYPFAARAPLKSGANLPRHFVAFAERDLLLDSRLAQRTLQSDLRFDLCHPNGPFGVRTSSSSARNKSDLSMKPRYIPIAALWSVQIRG